MIVIGGAYDEVCSDPALNWTFGSAVRAAAILGGQVELLITAVDAGTLERVRAVLGSVQIDHADRVGPVRFVYDTPISPPQLQRHYEDRGLFLPDATADDAIVFGMVEATFRLKAKRAVVDPQHSLRLDEIQARVTAENLILVANSREVRQLANDPNPARAARTILFRSGATAVVLKAGAAGALVVTADCSVSVGIPAIPTDTVFPIGSGDVFTAAFAAAYFDGTSITDAARAASERTAGYCATRQTRPVSVKPMFDLAPPTDETLSASPCVYVAASFDTPEQRWSARTVAHAIDDVGGKSFYPLRDVGPVQDQTATATADLNALAGCASVIVLADAARTGPFFEAGWATRAGIPVVVVTSDHDPTRFTMLRGSGATVVHDLSTAVYHSIWQALRCTRSAAGS